MGYKQCLHTHSTFCDGKHTPEEMVLSAIEKGFDSIGFSGHSYIEELAEFSMDAERTKLYKAEIARLQQVYSDRIRIFCGMEKDNYTKASTAGFDYLLGAVHTVRHGESLMFMDWCPEKAQDSIDRFFGGDGVAYAKAYYAALEELPDYGKFDILAHFDLVTKFCEQVPGMIDTENPEYRAAAIHAVQALAGKVKFFEVNTGAMARGYRSAPYPAPFILEELKRQNFCPVITSDCHDKNFLDFAYEDAKCALKKAGFTEHYVLKDEGFVAVPLED